MLLRCGGPSARQLSGYLPSGSGQAGSHWITPGAWAGLSLPGDNRVTIKIVNLILPRVSLRCTEQARDPHHTDEIEAWAPGASPQTPGLPPVPPRPQGDQCISAIRSGPWSACPTFHPSPTCGYQAPGICSTWVARPRPTPVSVRPRGNCHDTHHRAQSCRDTHQGRVRATEIQQGRPLLSSASPSSGPAHGGGAGPGAGPRGRTAPSLPVAVVPEAGGADAGARVCGRPPAGLCVSVCARLLGPPRPPKWGFPLPVSKETNRSATTPAEGAGRQGSPRPHAPAHFQEARQSGVPSPPTPPGAEPAFAGPELSVVSCRGVPGARGVPSASPSSAKTGQSSPLRVHPMFWWKKT